MAEFQNSRPLHKAAALRVDFDVSLVDCEVERIRAMKIEDEVVPDSEEERLQRSKAKRRGLADGQRVDVIELASDEEEEEYIPVRRHGAGKTPRARRVVQSTDCESSENEPGDGAKSASQTQLPQRTIAPRTPGKSTGPVIDLTLSSSESDGEDIVPAKGKASKTQASRPTSRNATSHGLLSSQDGENKSTIPLFADGDSDDDDPMSVDDGSVLIFNEPRSARKPLRTTNLTYPSRNPPSSSAPSTPRRRIVSIHSTDSEESDTDAKSEASARSAKPAPKPKKTKATKAPKLSQRALEAAELQRRTTYARTFFEEMNREIFGCGLPSKTELKWNKRMTSTAGKASWHKTRDGAQTTQIELAVKILTDDERIRNTLSHEMCHLASWVISDAPSETHGDIFHGWARKVMRARPDIEVTTKHNYEIDYKYEWKCQECDKIYGRHSKSINPDECVCGACKVGKLIPMFPTTPRVPKTPRRKAGSAMASVKGRDSPLTISSPIVIQDDEVEMTVKVHITQETPTRTWAKTTKTQAVPGAFPLDDDEDDGEDDVQLLTCVLGGLTI
ncbi:SprT-like family-domain-containing protein [Rhodofomes roseus]|uniref:SprT-like family-domain-containing protein n=1 Tax=Rhodofomes roseus TaxID=34475 RepID=A0ABQ8KH26_9APHY|nr:SprT-like family-domain-containing protein [Rhodofomes roseus]KAH9836599.1 SprT-like family-domain-containing protein [Rhodofomes roseus]